MPTESNRSMREIMDDASYKDVADDYRVGREKEDKEALGIKTFSKGHHDPKAESDMIEALKSMQRGDYSKIQALAYQAPEIVPAFLQISVGDSRHRIKIESITGISWISDSSMFIIHVPGVPEIKVKQDHPDCAIVRELFNSFILVNPPEKDSR